jgi:hypothetical protein
MHDGEGVAGPEESTDSVGDGGVAQPRGANVRAVGSRRCSCGSGKDGGDGVNGGAAGLSFVFAQRAVGVVVSAGVPVPLPLSVLVAAGPELEGPCRWRRCNAAEILRAMLPHVRANGPHCIANIASAIAATKRVATIVLTWK